MIVDKEGKEVDPQGDIQKIISSLRKKDVPQLQVEKEREDDRQKLTEALKSYLSDYTSAEKKIACLNAFCAYASHNDLLQQKIDTIQDLDYNALSLLEQLFIDKDNLSVLLREALKDIPQGLYPKVPLDEDKGISNSARLAQTILAIWQSETKGIEKKKAAIAKMLEGVSKDEINQKLLPKITDNGVKQIMGSDPYSKKGLTPSIHDPIYTSFSAGDIEIIVFDTKGKEITAEEVVKQLNLPADAEAAFMRTKDSRIKVNPERHSVRNYEREELRDLVLSIFSNLTSPSKELKELLEEIQRNPEVLKLV